MKKQPKSVRRIINAFLEMRASRPLEKIMVTELCEKADINKSTFYAYYRDIYDLSEKLENEIIERILTSLPSPELIVSDPSLFARHLMNAFQANSSLISIIFSDSRTSALPERIDHALRELFYSLKPELRGDPKTELTLTYKIYGAYYAFFKNDSRESDKIDIINRLSSTLP